jgi:hypothetical protein
MSDQDTLRIARQLWDAWNAHDVDAVVKTLMKSTSGKRTRSPHPSSAAMATGRRCICISQPSRTYAFRSTSYSLAETTR